MSLSIREDLGSREAAEAYNRKIYDYRCEISAKGWHPGCVSALACVHCYHVISDSICLCIGVFTCPKCGKQNGELMSTKPSVTGPILFGSSFQPPAETGMYI